MATDFSRKITIKRRKSLIRKNSASLMSAIEEWTSYWRANPHRFICDYLGLKFKGDFQPALVCAMDRQPNFVYAASRGLGKSFMTMEYCVMRCILYPDTQIVVVAPTKKQSTNFILKIYELIKVSKNLLKEIADDGIKTGQNDSSILFCNGSKIWTATFSENSRSARATILIVDEFAQLKDNKLLVSTFIPMLTAPRSPLYLNIPDEEREKYQEPTRQLYLSSIRSEAEWSWVYFLKYLNFMTNGDLDYFALSLPYQLGVEAGYILRKNVEQQYLENELKRPLLLAEYEAIPIRSDDGAFFKYSALQKSRDHCEVFVAKSDEEYLKFKGKKDKWDFYIPKQEGEIRILSMDVALIESPKNDNTMFWITRLIPNGEKYYKSIAYGESLHGLNAVIQAKRAKQIFYEMECDWFAIDTVGAGSGLADVLMGETYDEIRGELYPAWTTANPEDDKTARRALSRDAVPCMYAMKTSSLDKHTRFITMRDMIETGELHLPVSDLEAIDYYNKTKHYYKISDESLKARMLNTYVQTELMILEAINLETVISNGLYNLKEKPSKRKDRVMSLCYNLDIVRQKEKQYIAEQEQGESGFLDFVFV